MESLDQLTGRQGGSELQDDLGYENSYSTFYRDYDQVLGRFNAMDPAVDKYADWTPYNFAFDDPGNKNDPGGDDPDTRRIQNPPPPPGSSGGGTDWAPYTDPYGNQTWQQQQGIEQNYAGFQNGAEAWYAYANNQENKYARQEAQQEQDDQDYQQAVIASHASHGSNASNVTNASNEKNVTSSSQVTPVEPADGSISGVGIILNEVVITATVANQGDPYSYAGNLFHVPANNLPADNGSIQQIAQTCVFYTIAAGLNYFGKNIDGATVLDRFKINGKVINDYQETMILNRGLPNSLVASAYDQYFIGSYESTSSGYMNFMLGNPLLGTYQVSQQMSHNVFITGVSYFSSGPNAGYNFAFWNPATGFYGFAPMTTFYHLYSVTMAK